MGVWAEAAERLHVHIFRIGWAVACETLDAAESPLARAGVTVASVDREIQWRTNANRTAKVRRRIRDAIRWL